jgi:hypothetical protein
MVTVISRADADKKAAYQNAVRLLLFQQGILAGAAPILHMCMSSLRQNQITAMGDMEDNEVDMDQLYAVQVLIFTSGGNDA